MDGISDDVVNSLAWAGVFALLGFGIFLGASYVYYWAVDKWNTWRKK